MWRNRDFEYLKSPKRKIGCHIDLVLIWQQEGECDPGEKHHSSFVLVKNMVENLHLTLSGAGPRCAFSTVASFNQHGRNKKNATLMRGIIHVRIFAKRT